MGADGEVMPLFDYQCDECGAVAKDVLRPRAPHPTCCGKPMRKLVAKPAEVHSSAKTWRYTEGPRQWSSNIGTPDHD